MNRIETIFKLSNLNEVKNALDEIGIDNLRSPDHPATDERISLCQNHARMRTVAEFVGQLYSILILLFDSLSLFRATMSSFGHDAKWISLGVGSIEFEANEKIRRKTDFCDVANLAGTVLA